MKALSVISVLAFAAAALAQTSAYYVTQGTSGNGNTYVLQGGALQFQYAWAAPGQMPIVIGNFGSGTRVRQACGQPTSGGPQQGDEYTLGGVATGFTNFWDSGDPVSTTAYDAGFNGKNILMVHWGGATDGQVFGYDNNYGNGAFMFKARPGDLGITFDSATGTIWTSNWFDGQVSQWSMGGALLFSYTAGSGSSIGALAYDAADDTFWLADNGSGLMLQYDRSGKIISRMKSPDYVLGGEMNTVPEPITLIAMGMGLAALARKRRNRA